MLPPKPSVLKKKLVQEAQPVHRRRIRRDATLEPRQHLIDLTQHLLHIQIRVFVLRQAHGCLKQRKPVITLHQRRKVAKRCGRGQRQVHANIVPKFSGRLSNACQRLKNWRNFKPEAQIAPK